MGSDSDFVLIDFVLFLGNIIYNRLLFWFHFDRFFGLYRNNFLKNFHFDRSEKAHGLEKSIAWPMTHRLLGFKIDFFQSLICCFVFLFLKFIRQAGKLMLYLFIKIYSQNDRCCQEDYQSDLLEQITHSSNKREAIPWQTNF